MINTTLFFYSLFFLHQRDASQAVKLSVHFISCYASPADSSGETEEKLHLPIYMSDALALSGLKVPSLAILETQPLTPQKNGCYLQSKTSFKLAVLILKLFH